MNYHNNIIFIIGRKICYVEVTAEDCGVFPHGGRRADFLPGAFLSVFGKKARTYFNDLMKSHFVLRLKNKLNQFGIFSIGCSNREIKELEDYARLPLPAVYKEFIANFGKGVGNYLNDINIFYNDLFENKSSAEELLHEDKTEFNLKETDFVFCSYLGSQFMFFSLLEGNDPPVYYYSEGELIPSKKFDALSDFLVSFFEDVFGKIE